MSKVNVRMICCTQFDDVWTYDQFNYMSFDAFAKLYLTCTCIRFEHIWMLSSQMCTNMREARIDRRKRCTRCTIRRYNERTHMSKTVLQIEDRDPIVARTPRELKTFKVSVLFLGLYISHGFAIFFWQMARSKGFDFLQMWFSEGNSRDHLESRRQSKSVTF